MKIWIPTIALALSSSSMAATGNHVTGSAIEFEGYPLGINAIPEMERQAQALCESLGAQEAVLASEITLQSTPIHPSYGKSLVSASALFFCEYYAQFEGLQIQ